MTAIPTGAVSTVLLCVFVGWPNDEPADAILEPAAAVDEAVEEEPGPADGKPVTFAEVVRWIPAWAYGFWAYTYAASLVYSILTGELQRESGLGRVMAVFFGVLFTGMFAGACLVVVELVAGAAGFQVPLWSLFFWIALFTVWITACERDNQRVRRDNERRTSRGRGGSGMFIGTLDDGNEGDGVLAGCAVMLVISGLLTAALVWGVMWVGAKFF